MTEPRRFSIFDFLLLVAVLILAVIPRVGYVLLFPNSDHPQGTLFVQDLPSAPQSSTAPAEPEPTELHTLVDNVMFDRGFIAKAPFADKEEPTAHTAPVFPVLVGLLARIVDPHSLDRTVQWLQVAFGTLTAGLYFLFARRAFRSTTVGLVAGVLTALYPLWIVNTAAINDGTLTAFLLALILFLGVRAGQSGGAFSSLLFGLMLAALSMTRAYYFPFALVALAWFLLRSRLLTHGWLYALVAFLGFIIGLAPWTVRNYQLFGEPVPVVDTAYYHVWIGTNPQATGGPVTDDMVKEAERKLNDGAAKKLAETDQPERYSRLGPIVSDTLQNRTLDVVNARIKSALYFFLGKEFFDHGLFVAKQSEPEKKDNEDKKDTVEIGDFAKWMNSIIDNTVNIVFAITMVLMLGLGILGWRWTYGWRQESRIAALAMIWIPLPYILTHAEALHGPRLPLDGVLLSYVAFALCCLVPGVGGYLFAGSAGVKGEKVV